MVGKMLNTEICFTLGQLLAIGTGALIGALLAGLLAWMILYVVKRLRAGDRLKWVYEAKPKGPQGEAVQSNCDSGRWKIVVAVLLVVLAILAARVAGLY